ncbi:MAG TPA: hypothetical protein VH088_17645 [Terriglobales bacterium]|nr:hypothetical protein [Terriglobales bacterium]
MAIDASAGIVFWVVVRDRATRKILRTHQFSTHEEAVHYHLSPDDPDNADDKELTIEILAPGKQPK